MNTITFYKLKNKVSVLLPEEWSDNGSDNGFPIIRTEKHYNNYGPLHITNESFELLNVKDADKERTYDYLIMDGYDRNLVDCKDSPSYKNVKVKEVLISHPGEYTTPDELEKFGYWLTNNNIQYNKKKVVLSVDEYIEEKHGWEIFEYPFSALRFFCGANNSTFVPYGSDNHTFMGTPFNEHPKPRIFNCLMNASRRGRLHLAKALSNSNILKYGTVHWNNYEWEDETIESYGEHWVDSKWKSPEDRFRFHPAHSQNAYIEVQCESHIYQNSTFVTEKSSKAFMGLQFPFFFAQPNYYQYFRDWGFDMFDDIFDHSYDTLPIDTEEKLHYKAKVFVDELKKATKLDMHKLYIENRDRLLHNQKRLFELVHIDNDREFGLGKFIFGNNINKSNSFTKKVYQ